MTPARRVVAAARKSVEASIQRAPEDSPYISLYITRTQAVAIATLLTEKLRMDNA